MTVIHDFLVSSFLCVRQCLEVVSYTEPKHIRVRLKFCVSILRFYLSIKQAYIITELYIYFLHYLKAKADSKLKIEHTEVIIVKSFRLIPFTIHPSVLNHLSSI